MKKIFLHIILLFVASSPICQTIENFTGLKSGGQIPADFTVLSTDKFSHDYVTNEDWALKKDFFLGTRFFIDDLLLSGNVIFNEPLSSYVSQVAHYVLGESDDLKNKLRFYVIKTTAANAFSTDQGILFFTTGLLARLENEAQLAFVIAHEVSHYVLHHVREKYIARKNLSYSTGRYGQQTYRDGIVTLSIYNRELELEADNMGIQYFLKTEYDINEIYASFEVLLRSYLPFKEEIFDLNYFNSDLLKIPTSYFPDKITEVTADPHFDNEESTHPNIATRIDRAKEFIDSATTNGIKKFHISKDTFFLVQTLARFEIVNLHLADRMYGDALYDCYILEHEFPNNRFLELSKVKAWYGLVKYKNHNRYSEVASEADKIEGESSILHGLLHTLSKTELNIIAFRQCYDIAGKYPQDSIFSKYLIDLKKELAINSGLNPSDLKNIRYENSIEKQEYFEFSFSDSIHEENFVLDSSNYEKDSSLFLNTDTIDLSISEKEFSLYALSDLVSKNNLISELHSIRTNHQKKVLQDSLDALEYVAAKKEQDAHLGIKKIIVVDPIYENYGLDSEKKLIKSESKKVKISSIYETKYKNLDLETVLLDSKILRDKEVEKFNDIALINSWSYELAQHKGLDMMTSSHDRMSELTHRYGTSHFLFTGIYSFKEQHEWNNIHMVLFLTFYGAPFALMDIMIVHNDFEFVAIEIDADTDRIEFVQAEQVNLKSLNKTLAVYIYDVLYQINSHK